jgi:hypothetical protein
MEGRGYVEHPMMNEGDVYKVWASGLEIVIEDLIGIWMYYYS